MDSMKLAKPKKLLAIQRLAAGAIRGRLDENDRTPRSMQPVAESFIKPNDRLTSLERLEIYNRQYWFRLLDILYDDYPGIRAIIGDAAFHEMSKAYLDKYPSRSFTLRNLGSKLEKFLAEQPRWGGKRQAMVLDMVRFEWAQVIAFDGPADAVISPDVVAATDPRKLKLSLQPYLTLLDMAYPLDDFIMAVKRQSDALRSEASNAIETPSKRKKHKPVRLPRAKRTQLAVHRYENMIFYKRLEPAAFEILKNLQAGKPLAKACDLAMAKSPKSIAPAKLGRWFQVWSELGWLCARKAK